MNYLMAAFPTRIDLDNWEELGNKGWGFDDLSPYFRKFERFSPPSTETATALQTSYLDPSLHGQGGPIHTSIPKSYWPLTDAWTSTIDNLGVAPHKDSKAGIATGGHTTLALVDPSSSTRSYAATGYFQPNANRPNLFLTTDAHVTKVNIKKEGLLAIATSVKLIVDDKEMTVKANREIIVCAGTFGSPQILELSGVGKSSLLTSYGIDVVLENDNVGENYQDHPLSFYSAEVAEGEDTMESLKEPAVLQQAIQGYTVSQTGFLAASLVSSAAFVPFKAACTTGGANASLEDQVAAIDGLVSPVAERVATGLDKQYELIRDGILNQNQPSSQYLLIHAGLPASHSGETSRLQTELAGKYITVVPCLMHPFSRGSVHICSKSPTVLPKVDPRWLSHPADLKVFCKHMLHAANIFSTEPLSSRLKDGGKALQPGYYTLTEDNVEEFVKNNTDTQHHPIGTCSMLPKESGGVVDTHLIVYGTLNLRVVDASVIPLQISANPTCTIYAMAEKVADMIKERWEIAV